MLLKRPQIQNNDDDAHCTPGEDDHKGNANYRVTLDAESTCGFLLQSAKRKRNTERLQ